MEFILKESGLDDCPKYSFSKFGHSPVRRNVKTMYSRVLKPEVTDYKVLIILWKDSFSALLPQRPSLSSPVPELAVQLDIFRVKFYI